ncbi:MAG: DNA-processing protein DprA [Patescibacteria group bacterium]
MNQKNLQDCQGDQGRYAALAFNYFQKIGPINLSRLENYFPDLETAFKAGRSELERAGLSAKLAAEFSSWRTTFKIEKSLNELEKENIKFITWHDPAYPALLKEIAAPPPLLYYKGRLPDYQDSADSRSSTNYQGATDYSVSVNYPASAANHGPRRLAVVGAREPSAYAEKIIEELLPPLIDFGIEIISGLALGVDSLAHRATLSAAGKTYAILGSGLDRATLYPPENIQLADEIISCGGAIISEFPPGTPPYRQNFPQRNRIISGLSLATLIIEAQEKSGALITAYRALEQNREVLAVPGNIFSSLSAGPNKLIQAGARAILSAEDILEIFNFTEKPENKRKKRKNRLKNSTPDNNTNSDAIYNNAIANNANSINKTLLSPAAPKSTAPPSFNPENANEKIVYELIKIAAQRGEKISADEIISASRLDTSLINSTLSIMELKGIIRNNGHYELN